MGTPVEPLIHVLVLLADIYVVVLGFGFGFRSAFIDENCTAMATTTPTASTAHPETRRFTRGLGKPGTAAELRQSVSEVVRTSVLVVSTPPEPQPSAILMVHLFVCVRNKVPLVAWCCNIIPSNVPSIYMYLTPCLSYTLPTAPGGVRETLQPCGLLQKNHTN